MADDFMADWSESGDAAEALEEVRLIINAEAAKILRNEVQLQEDDKIISEIDQKIEAMREEIAQLQIKRRDLNAQNYDRKRVVADARKQMDRAKSRESLIEETVKREEELQNQILSLMERAKKFKWYERMYDHQLEGSYFLANAGRALLADVPGLGKTLSSFGYCDLVKARKVLGITPGEISRGFQKEAAKWADHRKPFMLQNKRRQYQFNVLNFLIETEAEDALVIINYEALTNGNRKDLLKLRQLLMQVGFDTIVIDEAHRMKNMSTETFKAVKQIMMENNVTEPFTDNRPNSYNTIKNCLLMTGSPILNRPTEIFPLLHLIAPHIFYSEAMFRTEFCTYVWQGDTKRLVLKPGGKASLQRKLAGFYLRRTYEDAGIVLPPQEIIEHDLVINKDQYPLQWQLIQDLRKNAAMQIDEGRAKTVSNMLALLTRERQACTWPGGIYINEPKLDAFGLPMYEFGPDGNYQEVVERIHVGARYQESIKLDRAVEIYQESRENGQRVIFASKFKECLKELRRRLPDIAEYDGDTSRDERHEMNRNAIQDDFLPENDYKKVRDDDGYILHKWGGVAVHYTAAGLGLTLTGATVMVILDSGWNAEEMKQMFARIHRIGQESQTQVHKLIVQNTADEYLERLVMVKGQLVDGFQDTMKEHMDEILELFRKPLSDGKENE